MKLSRLSVERFQCIEQAEVELGPGLNVLFGPNDLGKSSLAWAIRAALLMQHNSAQHERFVSWYGGGEPKVQLTFLDDEARFWRVTKVFATTAGRSTLETSKDGRTWTPDAVGRQVDEKLRAMMRWGIPAPGGGSTRGMPESFLTQVLLAEQDSVRDVLFGASITDDPDETGRQRLVEALGALAQDPLFKHVLDVAQEHVDEAFTPKGNRKKGAGSPFKEISDRVKDLQRERDGLVTKLRDTEATERRMRELAAERDQLLEEQVESAQELAVAERDFAVQQQRDAIEARIAEHLRVVTEADERERQIAEMTKLLAEADGAVQAQAKAAKAAAAVIEKAERDRDAARAEYEKLAHDDAQSDRAKASLEEAVRAAADSYAQAQAEERRATDELTKAKVIAVQIAELEKEQATLATASGQAGRERELWIGVAFAALGRLRAEETALRKKIQPKLPDAATLAELRELHEQLRIAEAKVEVGLAVEIRPKKALTLKTKRDGGKETTSKGTDSRTVSAKRSIALVIDDLVELEISAGDEATRDEVADLQKRWKTTGGKLLDDYDVESLEGIAKLRAASDDAARAADERKRTLEQIARYTDELDEPELDEDDEAEVESRIAKLKGDLGAKVLEKLADFERGGADHQKIAIVEAKLAALRASLEAGVDTKKRKPADPLEVKRRAAMDAEEWRVTAKAALDIAKGKLETFVKERAALIKAARDKLTKAETEAKAARTKAEAQVTQSATSTELFNQLRVQHAELMAAQKVTNVAAARAAIAKAKPELDALGPGSELEEADVENLRQRAAKIATRLREAEVELHRASGALEHVGGAIVREEQRELDAAIALAEETEEKIAIEYDAWKLLVDTLRESESTEGAHLGRALGGPVSKRFSELTGARYGELALGANLDDAAVMAGGVFRDPKALSAGTQDQLATLLRLCVAEQLHSMIVIDDHLAQSDLSRVSWFNKVLRDAAEQIQIVFLTCRPSELLGASELPTTEPVRNLAGGRVRAIDLSRMIQRYSRQ